MTAYGATGVNAALSSRQFIAGDNAHYAWNLEVWSSLTCGAPIDAPDSIPAGACHDNWHPQRYINRD